MSTTEVSDGTENAGGVPEKRAGDLPVVETARVKSPETIGSDIPAAAGADAGTSDRAQDPAAPHSAPQLTAADSSTSSPPKIAAPMSTADGSDGAGNAGSVPEKKGGPPAMETLGVKNPEAIGSDVPAAAGADAGAADREKTHVVSENSYGLQLIGFFSRRTLDEFAYQKGLPARIYVIRETYRRRPWHTIIHSLHPDRAAAKEELSRLPAELAALGPLVRPLRKGTKLQVIETGAE